MPYELPDGNVVVVNSERFKCPEAMFKPELVEKELSGIHEITFQSIMRCDVDIRPDLYANIVLSGGNTLFKTMEERLENEIKTLRPGSTQLKVYAPAERK